MPEWRRFFKALTHEAYPALKEVKVAHLAWPASECVSMPRCLLMANSRDHKARHCKK